MVGECGSVAEGRAASLCTLGPLHYAPPPVWPLSPAACLARRTLYSPSLLVVRLCWFRTISRSRLSPAGSWFWHYLCRHSLHRQPPSGHILWLALFRAPHRQAAPLCRYSDPRMNIVDESVLLVLYATQALSSFYFTMDQQQHGGQQTLIGIHRPRVLLRPFLM